MHPIAEGDTVTMCDVLEEEAALEDDAAAVLGPADHKNCSYMSGGQCYIQSGADQTKGFRPLLYVFIPSIYRIFRTSQNTNRWRIIDTMFAKSQPLDARVMFFR